MANDVTILENPHVVVKCTNRQELATDCLKWRLYSPGGFMRSEYIHTRDNLKSISRRRLLVLYVAGVPAASIIGCKNCIMVYVDPVFRRSGYGTFMINHYIRKYRLKRSDLRARPGIRGSAQLYWSCGIQKSRSVLEFYEAFDWRVVIPIRIDTSNV